MGGGGTGLGGGTGIGDGAATGGGTGTKFGAWGVTGVSCCPPFGVFGKGAGGGTFTGFLFSSILKVYHLMGFGIID
jgi:hypothetical protein